jgi:hypothetical protein
MLPIGRIVGDLLVGRSHKTILRARATRVAEAAILENHLELAFP